MPYTKISLYFIIIALFVALFSLTARADYWDGTAPFCSGSCNSGDQAIRTSKCGDGKCCWTGHKVLCRPTAASGPACFAKQTRTECFGVVEVCDDGYYVAPQTVWKSCHKYVCGACFGFSFESKKMAFRSARCGAGLVFRGAVEGDEVCVQAAVHEAAVKDNAAAASRREPNGGASGPDTCRQGFVWREATPTDHVCVTPQTRAETAADTKAAASRVADAGKPYGPDTCKQGFVWREAIGNDHVCVTPGARDVARRQNEQAASHRSPTGGAYGPETCSQGFVWREVVPNDRACVTPAERDQAAADALAAHDRRAE